MNTPIIYAAAYSTTGRAKNGKCDTICGVRLKFESNTHTRFLPFRDATMNQALLWGIIYGMHSLLPAVRSGLKIITDSRYPPRALERNGQKWLFVPESNHEIVTSIRNLFGSISEASVIQDAQDSIIQQIRIELKKLGKLRLEHAS
jgi:hypothetical protein